ncbi:MAG: PH domain-containing protein [Planctomycetales bacterium]|nr:PH domain-containing protein [Planctomycetales bacterium]
MSNEPVQWYSSKVDWWLAALLCVPPVASVAVTVGFATHGNAGELPWGIGSIALVATIYFGLVFPMRYGIDDTHLVVRSGMIWQHIRLANIIEVHPTHNPLSSPALSLDRLYVKYGESWTKAVMISPANRDRFLDELASKTGLKREGDRLVSLKQMV